MKYIFFILSTIFVLTSSSSCKQKSNYTKEISSLDSSVIELKKSENNLLNLDTLSIQKTFSHTEITLKTLHNLILKDTINKKSALQLSTLYEQFENLQYFFDNQHYFIMAARENIHQIENLKYDLKENLVEPNKANEFIHNELSSSTKVTEIITEAIAKAKNASKKLDSLSIQHAFPFDSILVK